VKETPLYTLEISAIRDSLGKVFKSVDRFLTRFLLNQVMAKKQVKNILSRPSGINSHLLQPPHIEALRPEER
jgi:hypothetical protein